jgi:hypothetical protein
MLSSEFVSHKRIMTTPDRKSESVLISLSVDVSEARRAMRQQEHGMFAQGCGGNHS